MLILAGESETAAARRDRKKKSRWGGGEADKTFIPGMPTILPSTLDPTQQEAYLGKYNTLIVDAFRITCEYFISL